MTPNPQNADKFDVEEVEKALSEISPWPWFFKDEKYQGSGAVYPNVITSTLHAIAHISSGFTYEYKINSNESERRDALNGLFISKSPQRLAAAVERIRFLEDVVNKYQLRIEKAAVSPPNALNKSSDYLDGWVEGLESIMATSILKSSDEE